MPFICAKDLALTKENVAVAVMQGAFGSHLGLIFNSAKDGLQLLHLRFHNDLKVESFPQVKNYCWVAAPANISPVASKAFVAIVRALSKRLPSIKYGINFLAAKNSIDQSAAYKAPKGSDGLTCATFVVEVFRAAGLPLLKEESWPSTEENVAWGLAVCTLLTNQNVDPAHIEQVRNNVIGLRIRPEEVAAASQLARANLPVDFTTVKEPAGRVMESLHLICAAA